MRDTRRALVFGMLLPALVPLFALPTLGMSSLLLGVYPLRAFRIAKDAKRRGLPAKHAAVWAVHCVGASFPQAAGIVSYHWQKLQGRDPSLIEYK